MSTVHNHHNPTNTPDRAVPRSSRVPTRTDRVVTWIGWHFWELCGVAVSTGVAVSVTPWAWFATALITVVWLVHEVRVAREQAPLRAAIAAERAHRAAPSAALPAALPAAPDTAPGAGVDAVSAHDASTPTGQGSRTGAVGGGPAGSPDPAAGWGSW